MGVFKMKYKKTTRPLQRDYSSKYMGWADRPRKAPSDTLDNQPDQESDVQSQLSDSVGGTRTHPKKGKRRWEHPTWKDKLKQKFKMKKRKKIKNSSSGKSGGYPYKSAK